MSVTGLKPETTATFDRYWDDLEPVGTNPSGGYSRFAWTPTDMGLREWFTAAAIEQGLDVTVDRVGNQWAWWGDPDADGPGLVIGSHLDSVPGGGAFDGPLGVVSSLAAIGQLRAEGWTPPQPLGVVNFIDEEGARFGVACAGSRLLTGAMTAERGLALTDVDGVCMAEAMQRVGHDPAQVGVDHETLGRVGAFIELHVEQGKNLADTPHALAAGSAIWPHGRWRVDFTGCGDHAGTTRLVDRVDPMLDVAQFVLDVRATAERHDVVGTVGKMHITPGGVNAIPTAVTAWLDARGSNAEDVRAAVADLSDGRAVSQESWTDRTVFDETLTAQVASSLGETLGLDGAAPILETGAGHDAGILANHGVPTTMMYVRNPTGVSHAPAEFAERPDCHVGVLGLSRIVKACAADPRGVGVIS